MSFETSASTERLDAALAKAQSQIKAAVKDAENPFFKSMYADLPAVWSACQGPLTENGISVSQWPVHSEDGRMHIVTRLAHAGEWMRCEFSIPVAKQDAQGFGSAVTYARRFALAAAVGVVAEDDDDGVAASESPKGRRRGNDVPMTPHASPSGGAASSGSAPETDKQKIARWSESLRGAKKLDELLAIGKRISEDKRLSDPVRLELSAEYTRCSERIRGHANNVGRKAQKPGPCSICGAKEHDVSTCPNATPEERATAGAA